MVDHFAAQDSSLSRGPIRREDVTIEVEVVDVPLDYNLLLGRNWMYSMQVVASSLF